MGMYNGWEKKSQLSGSGGGGVVESSYDRMLKVM